MGTRWDRGGVLIFGGRELQRKSLTILSHMRKQNAHIARSAQEPKTKAPVRPVAAD